MENNSWCPLPWIGLSIRNNGDVRVCCNANVSAGNGLIKNQNGVVYNLIKDSFQECRNGQLMKDIRLAILNNTFHPSCIRCKQEAAAGMQTRMHWETEIWQNEININKAQLITSSDGSIDTKKTPIRYIDIRFGNTCNLKCRMCGPTDSNQWYDETVALWGEQYTDGTYTISLTQHPNGHYFPENSTYTWYNNPKFWEELENEIHSIERLYIVGGEPLLIQQHYDFLQKCIDVGQAAKMVLEYNTNITIIPEKTWSLWKEFKKIQIGISLDAVEELNDYIRYPSKWEIIEENLHNLDKAEGNFLVWWAATIQVYNIIHLPEIMLWKITQEFSRINKDILGKPVISPHPLHNPKFLNIKMFPKESKHQIEIEFNEWKLKSKKIIYNLSSLSDEDKELNYEAYCDILDHYVKYMKSDDYSDQLEKFWRYNNILDNSRSENLKDVSPQTWRLLLGDEYNNK